MRRKASYEWVADFAVQRGAELFPVVGNYLVLFFDGVCSGDVGMISTSILLLLVTWK